MKYLEQLKYFDQWTDGHYLPGKAQLMWFKLMQFNNRLHWQKKFNLDNHRLMAMVDSSSERDVIRIRNILIEEGLLRFVSGCKGHPSTYEMLAFWGDQDGLVHAGAEKPEDCQNGSESVSKSESQSVSESDSETEVKKEPAKKEHKPKANAYKSVSDFEEKSAYGEFENVWLKDKEVEKLNEKYPGLLDAIIETLSSYKASKDKGYASDYGAINSWVIKSVLEDHQKQVQQFDTRKPVDRALDEMIEENQFYGGLNDKTGNSYANQTYAPELPDVPF